MAREKLPEHTERAMTACRNAKPESKQYELLDSKIPGLELRVNAKGKEWSLRYRVKVGEKWLNKRLPLGDFPAVTVANARSAAQQAKTDIARGSDPMGDRRKEAELRAEEIKAKALEEASRIPVAEAFERWMKSDKPAGRHDGGAELRRLFERDVLPNLGKKTMSDVTRADILEIIDEILLAERTAWRSQHSPTSVSFSSLQRNERSFRRTLAPKSKKARLVKNRSLGNGTLIHGRFVNSTELFETAA